MRYYFKKQKERDSFFNEIRKSYFNSWKDMYNYLNVIRSKLEYYRNGKLTIHSEHFLKLLELLPKKRQGYFKTIIYKKSDNWGQVKGGKKTYDKYKYLFDKGRQKGLLKLKKRLKYDFDINLPLSEDLCEFLGAFTGDGFTNYYGCGYLIQFTGDSRFDLHYCENTLIPIAKSLFGVSPKIIKKGNILRLNIYSKKLFHLLTKRFNFPKGKKVYTVDIPTQILNSNKKFLSMFIRGILDTDGTIFFDKRKNYSKPYIRFGLYMANKDLVHKIHNFLLSLNIKSNLTHTRTKTGIQINGFKNVKLLVNKIGFSNKRHLDKLVNLPISSTKNFKKTL